MKIPDSKGSVRVAAYTMGDAVYNEEGDLCFVHAFGSLKVTVFSEQNGRSGTTLTYTSRYLQLERHTQKHIFSPQYTESLCSASGLFCPIVNNTN